MFAGDELLAEEAEEALRPQMCVNLRWFVPVVGVVDVAESGVTFDRAAHGQVIPGSAARDDGLHDDDGDDAEEEKIKRRRDVLR